jgi:hypothetical protein
MRMIRPVTLTLLAVGLAGQPAPAAPSSAEIGPGLSSDGVPSDGVIEFAVFRKGDRIGTHRLTFEETGDRLRVHVDVSLKVEMLFVTVYRYRHESTETWLGDRMVAFRSETRQNGKHWEVAAHHGGEHLVIQAGDQQRLLPDTLLPTSYWKPEMVAHSRWFNTQFGSPIDVDVAPRGTEPVEAAGRVVAASRYKVTGVVAETGKPVDLDLWYADGELVKMQFVAVADGSLIEFQRVV